jgi:lipopolysaccharide transport system ATP-binding protein
MAMRLGFAIATQIEPDVLVIDEALSVGDGYFQKKCMDRMTEFTDQGGTLLFCSHAMYYVSSFCERALWMRGGRVEELGPAAEVVRNYENFLLTKGEDEVVAPPLQPSAGEEKQRPGAARIVGARLLDPLSDAPEEGPRTFRYGDPWTLEVEWETNQPALPFHVAVGIDRVDAVQVASFSTWKEGEPFVGRSRYRACLHLDALPIVKGEFSVFVYLMDEKGLHPYDQKILPRAFVVHGDEYEIGLTRIAHTWVPAEVVVEG